MNMKVRQLGPNDTHAALRLLNSDSATNLYQIDILLRNPLPSFSLYEWRGVFVDQTLVAISLSAARLKPRSPSSLCVPYGDPDACRLLGEAEAKLGGTANLLGPKMASDMLYAGLGQPKAPVWYDEQLYVCREQSVDEPYLTIRPAVTEELDILEPMAAQMQMEDVGSDPRKGNIEAHRHRIAQQIRQQRIWVAEVDSQIAFSMNVGTQSPLGVQVGSIFVPPHMRRRGIATRAMRGVNLHFLRQSAMVTLLVRKDNIPAIRAYQKANYIGHTDFRLAELNLE